jgi:hypothetical protein
MYNNSSFYKYPGYIPPPPYVTNASIPLFYSTPNSYSNNKITTKDNHTDINHLTICTISNLMKLLYTTKDPQIEKDLRAFESTFELNNKQSIQIKENFFDLQKIFKHDYPQVEKWISSWSKKIHKYINDVRNSIPDENIHFVLATHCNDSCDPNMAVIQYANMNNVKWEKNKEMYNNTLSKQSISVMCPYTNKKVYDISIQNEFNFENDNYQYNKKNTLLEDYFFKGIPVSEYQNCKCINPYPNSIALGSTIASQLGIKEGENATVFIDISRLLEHKDKQMKPTLQLGDNGEDIKFLQSILNKLGYVTSKEIDNMYNYNIEKAVKIFQIDEGLTPDGIVGSKTWVRLLNYEK